MTDRGGLVGAVRALMKRGPTAPVNRPPVHSYPALVAELRQLRWTPGGDVQLEGWTYLSTAPASSGPIRVWAQLEGSEATWPAVVVARTDLEPNAFTSIAEDLSRSAWTATFPVAELGSVLQRAGSSLALAGSGAAVQRLRVWVELGLAGQLHHSPLTGRYRWGSAERLPGRRTGTRWWVSGQWRGVDGLVLSVRSAGLVAERVTAAGDQLEVTVSALGQTAATSVLLSAGPKQPIPFGGPTETLRLGADQLPVSGAVDLIWTAVDGSRHRVLADTPSLAIRGAPATAVSVATSTDGGLTLTRRARLAQLVGAVVTDTTGTDLALRISGTLAGRWAGPLRLELRGARETFGADVAVAGGAFETSIPLLRDDAWGHAGLAPLAGGYRLWLVDGAGAAELPQLSADLVSALHTWTFTDRFSARLEHHPDGGGLWLMVLDPRPLDQIGSYARRQLRAGQQKGEVVAEVEDAVYFESFVGESCACNPKAIFAELARRDLGLSFFWGVRDLSVPVPAGATAVTIDSAQWWRVRHQARYLVTNDWLNDTFRHRAHQRVLQTWHGTAYKLLGLDRPRAREDAPFVRAIQTENAKWDLLLAQNGYSVDQMRGAYDYEGPVLESGYPRNDLLLSPEAGAVRDRLRTRLGVTDTQQVVLYAPTWREDRTAVVTDLDVVELARQLGEEYVILVRGHAKTLRGNAARRSERVIDVTSYPDVSELFCAADVCLTDYSSVMFDFTVTGKPLLFFTPDHDAYVHRLRGAYFDLAASSPGPLLTDLTQTAEAIASAGQIRDAWDERYRAWRQRFNAWEDGSASTRAVEALLAL